MFKDRIKNCKLIDPNQTLITISIIFGSIALTFACVGLGTSNWQIDIANTTSGQTYIIRTANFFYACRLNSIGEVLRCGERITNKSILAYYAISGRGNESDLNHYLNAASACSILGIIFIFIGIITTLLMFFVKDATWVYFISPSYLFIACLFMFAGLAEGSRVLLYNGYSAHLYQTAHVLTIFSFFISTIGAGRLSSSPEKSKKSRKKNQEYQIHTIFNY